MAVEGNLLSGDLDAEQDLRRNSMRVAVPQADHQDICHANVNADEATRCDKRTLILSIFNQDNVHILLFPEVVGEEDTGHRERDQCLAMKKSSARHPL